MTLPRLHVRTLIVALILVAGATLFVRAMATRRDATGPVPTDTVARRDIVVTIDATGTVEPIDLVEIKSKASGQITVMPVQVGSQVKTGDLLAQIDPRDVRNQYDQALAALKAAQARVTIAEAQLKRSDELYAAQVITAEEHETATLSDANAQSDLVTARTNLDLARQRRDDATVRAPIAGTILSQAVSAGQVITSATSSASGGTSLLTMADLSQIRLRALVSETDIGSVHPGQTATVTVDAFPQRPFQGTVDKIEPQAVIQQSVTLFPVLISISNEQGLLLPGMNGEVSMLVERHDGVLSVPVDAVRNVRELTPVASALGMDPDSVLAQVRHQMAVGADSRDSQGGWGADSTRTSAWRAGGGGSGAPPDSSAGRSRRMGGSRGLAGAQGASRGGSGMAVQAGAGAGQGGRSNRASVVFVKTKQGLEPRVVHLGISDFDYAEVLDGVKEGEDVALLSVAEAQAKRVQTQNQIRQRMSGGLPGMPGGGGAGRGGGGGGGGGGGRGGGGTRAGGS